jgi:acyl-CoA dehydrogenase
MLGEAAGCTLDHRSRPARHTLDVRSLCLIRETLARHDGLADFAFAMQGLGTGAISLFGSHEQRQWLKKSRAGEVLTAFRLDRAALRL